jgi:hypothetical protein
MAKDKHKGNSQQKTQQSPANIIVVEKAPLAHNKTEKGEARNNNAEGKQRTSRWRRFKDYIKSKSSFTDWCIVAFTAALAAVAIYQYFITASQLDVMRKDERAWVVVTKADINQLKFEVGVDPSLPITITNTGKTPATDISSDFFIELIPNGSAPVFEAQGMHNTETIGLLIPNGYFNVVVERRKGTDPLNPDPDPVTNAESADYIAGKSWIIEYGVISYRDAFGILHWTRECAWFGSPGKMFQSKSCTEYNSTDKN